MSSFFEEPPQQEGEEIRKSVVLAAPADILVAELDTVGDIRIRRPIDEVVK